MYAPPVGTSLFVGCAIGGVSIRKLSITMIPFYMVMVAVVLAITYVPDIVLFLPRYLGQ